MNSLQKFDLLRQQNKFVFALVFRGHWCPFCMSYIRMLAGLEPAIKKAGGAAVIITSESEVYLEEVRSMSGYQGEAINDASNELVKDLSKKYAVAVAISEKKGYEYGMAQPALLVVTTAGTVLERWAIVPSMMNMGGAKDRPDLNQVWQNVYAKLNGGAEIHSRYSTVGVFRVLGEKLRS